MRRDSAGIDRPSSIAAAFTVPWRATSRKASMLLMGGRRGISVADDDMTSPDMPQFCAVRHKLLWCRGSQIWNDHPIFGILTILRETRIGRRSGKRKTDQTAGG